VPVARFVLRRIALTLVVLWGLATLVFLLIQFLPGDAARTAAGRNATPEQVQAVRERLGLDEPLPLQYLFFLGRLVRGDLGTSVFTSQPITSDLADVAPSSIELVAAAMLINLAVAVPLGVLAAVNRGRAGDLLARVVAILGNAVPVFWLGLVLQYLVGAKWGLLPISGQLGRQHRVPSVTGARTVDALLAGDLAAFGNAMAHLVLPAVVLAAPFIAVVARTLRSTLIGVLETEAITVVQAKGASPTRVVLRHGLRNALIPTTTIVGLQLGWMLGSTVLIESIFGRQGIGSYATTAVIQTDTFAVIGVVLVVGVVFTLASLAVDLLQLWLNPRLRTTVA
jgi:ABC-type dipeptide/oligopeptide/nickel transport system permease component